MVRSILIWPHPTLRTKSEFTDDLGSHQRLPTLQDLIRDMRETMEHHNGLGLAAVQVGVPVPIFVAKLSLGTITFIEPKLYDFSKEKEAMSEGCLSIPGHYENVPRAVRVFASFYDEEGDMQDLELVGRDAQIVQHEYDHLKGKMYPDRMDPGARDRIRAHIRKQMGMGRVA